MPEYAYKTPLIGLPVQKDGCPLYEKAEMKKNRMIESRLMVSSSLVGTALFRDGNYNIKETDSGFTVSLCAVGQGTAVSGSIRGLYVCNNSVVKWDALEKGEKYYLYLKYTKGLNYDSSAFRTVAVTRKIEKNDDFSLLMAVVDTTGEEPVVDPYPEGKEYIVDLFRKMKRKNGEKVDFLTGGETGTVVELDGNIDFVVVQPLPENLKSAGMFAVGYFEDGEVDSANKVAVYNTGEPDLKCRLVVFFRG